MAFQLGELLYATPSSDSNMYQTALRLYTMALDPVKDNKPDDAQKVSTRSLHILAYYMDYTGSLYVPIHTHISITHYEGEKDIIDLKIHPLRFVKNADRIKDELLKQGTWFRQAVTVKHLYYDGWTLIHGPTTASSDDKNRRSLAAEYIDGDVIIEFMEGYKSEQSLTRFGPASLNRHSYPGDNGFSSLTEGDDDLLIFHWNPMANFNSRQHAPHATIAERIQRTEGYAELKFIPPLMNLGGGQSIPFLSPLFKETETNVLLGQGQLEGNVAGKGSSARRNLESRAACQGSG